TPRVKNCSCSTPRIDLVALRESLGASIVLDPNCPIFDTLRQLAPRAAQALTLFESQFRPGELSNAERVATGRRRSAGGCYRCRSRELPKHSAPGGFQLRSDQTHEHCFEHRSLTM